VAFFYVPFILLFKLLTSITWSRRVVVGCFAIATGLGLLFAGIGFIEYATRHLLWHQTVIQSNEFESDFRVTSLICASTASSQLPWMKCIGRLKSSKRRSVSRGIGPGTTSPPTTI